MIRLCWESNGALKVGMTVRVTGRLLTCPRKIRGRGFYLIPVECDFVGSSDFSNQIFGRETLIPFCSGDACRNGALAPPENQVAEGARFLINNGPTDTFKN
jgi:hypothetical protein